MESNLDLFATLWPRPSNVIEHSFSEELIRPVPLEDIVKFPECDYDKNPTPLFKAIEAKKWDDVKHFLLSGYWRRESKPDEKLPSAQVCTWVTKYEAGVDGTDEWGKWTQLPIHAALIFGAPFEVIRLLLKICPGSARCADEQRLLPLHLAFRHGASDNVVGLLLHLFPKALNVHDFEGKTPLECAVDGPFGQRCEVIEMIISRHKDKWEKTKAKLEATQKRQRQILSQTKSSLRNMEKEVEKLNSEVDLIKWREDQCKTTLLTLVDELEAVNKWYKQQEKVATKESIMEDLATKLAFVHQLAGESLVGSARQRSSNSRRKADERRELFGNISMSKTRSDQSESSAACSLGTHHSSYEGDIYMNPYIVFMGSQDGQSFKSDRLEKSIAETPAAGNDAANPVEEDINSVEEKAMSIEEENMLMEGDKSMELVLADKTKKNKLEDKLSIAGAILRPESGIMSILKRNVKALQGAPSSLACVETGCGGPLGSLESPESCKKSSSNQVTLSRTIPKDSCAGAFNSMVDVSGVRSHSVDTSPSLNYSLSSASPAVDVISISDWNFNPSSSVASLHDMSTVPSRTSEDPPPNVPSHGQVNGPFESGVLAASHTTNTSIATMANKDECNLNPDVPLAPPAADQVILGKPSRPHNRSAPKHILRTLKLVSHKLSLKKLLKTSSPQTVFATQELLSVVSATSNVNRVNRVVAEIDHSLSKTEVIYVKQTQSDLASLGGSLRSFRTAEITEDPKGVPLCYIADGSVDGPQPENEIDKESANEEPTMRDTMRDVNDEMSRAMMKVRHWSQKLSFKKLVKPMSPQAQDDEQILKAGIQSSAGEELVSLIQTQSDRASLDGSERSFRASEVTMDHIEGAPLCELDDGYPDERSIARGPSSAMDNEAFTKEPTAVDAMRTVEDETVGAVMKLRHLVQKLSLKRLVKHTTLQGKEEEEEAIMKAVVQKTAGEELNKTKAYSSSLGSLEKSDSMAGIAEAGIAEDCIGGVAVHKVECGTANEKSIVTGRERETDNEQGTGKLMSVDVPRDQSDVEEKASGAPLKLKQWSLKHSVKKLMKRQIPHLKEEKETVEPGVKSSAGAKVSLKQTQSDPVSLGGSQRSFRTTTNTEDQIGRAPLIGLDDGDSVERFIGPSSVMGNEEAIEEPTFIDSVREIEDKTSGALMKLRRLPQKLAMKKFMKRSHLQPKTEEDIMMSGAQNIGGEELVSLQQSETDLTKIDCSNLCSSQRSYYSGGMDQIEVTSFSEVDNETAYEIPVGIESMIPVENEAAMERPTTLGSATDRLILGGSGSWVHGEAKRRDPSGLDSARTVAHETSRALKKSRWLSKRLTDSINNHVTPRVPQPKADKEIMHHSFRSSFADEEFVSLKQTQSDRVSLGVSQGSYGTTAFTNDQMDISSVSERDIATAYAKPKATVLTSEVDHDATKKKHTAVGTVVEVEDEILRDLESCFKSRGEVKTAGTPAFEDLLPMLKDKDASTSSRNKHDVAAVDVRNDLEIASSNDVNEFGAHSSTMDAKNVFVDSLLSIKSLSRSAQLAVLSYMNGGKRQEQEERGGTLVRRAPIKDECRQVHARFTVPLEGGSRSRSDDGREGKNAMSDSFLPDANHNKSEDSTKCKNADFAVSSAVGSNVISVGGLLRADQDGDYHDSPTVALTESAAHFFLSHSISKGITTEKHGSVPQVGHTLTRGRSVNKTPDDWFVDATGCNISNLGSRPSGQEEDAEFMVEDRVMKETFEDVSNASLDAASVAAAGKVQDTILRVFSDGDVEAFLPGEGRDEVLEEFLPDDVEHRDEVDEVDAEETSINQGSNAAHVGTEAFKIRSSVLGSVKGIIHRASRKASKTFAYKNLFPKSTNEHNTKQVPSRYLSKSKYISKRLTAVDTPITGEESMDTSKGYLIAGENPTSMIWVARE